MQVGFPVVVPVTSCPNRTLMAPVEDVHVFKDSVDRKLEVLSKVTLNNIFI